MKDLMSYQLSSQDMKQLPILMLLWVLMVVEVRCSFVMQNSNLTLVPHELIPNTEVLIDLKGNIITSLATGEFSNYSDLATLYLQENNITFVADDAFDGTSLTNLDLSKNSITTFPNLMSIAGGLVKFKMATNSITKVNQTILSELKHLEALDLAWNPITGDMPDFTEVGSLAPASAKLQLNINGLPSNTTTFCHFTNVYLINKPSKLVPQIICPEGSSITLVKTNSREYDSATDFSTLVIPNTVKTLHIEYNNLVDFPDLPMVIRSQIKSLLLTRDKISVILNGVLDGYELNNLNLNHNRLTQISPELFYVTKALKLQSNPIEQETSWNMVLCNEPSFGLTELDLRDSIDSLMLFLVLTKTLCQRTQVLKIKLQGVSSFISKIL